MKSRSANVELVMPPDMAISMRHSKITAKEAALLSGEINKPSWESRNEGIHERVSFEDTIWGFDLAGGSFYKTPLRVTYVKPDSRADRAGIRPGDKLKRINDIDTSTLTIQEAHDIIVESGVHIKLAVTAPEDEEDSYNCYQDPIDTGYDSEEERRKEEERAKKRQVHARVSHFWSLQWPWVSKRRVIYRESNCFMVPSKFEEKHREKFPIQPRLRVEDDIVLHSSNLENENLHLRGNETNQNEPLLNGDEKSNAIYQEQFVTKPKNTTLPETNSFSENTEETKSNTLTPNETLSNGNDKKHMSVSTPKFDSVPAINGDIEPIEETNTVADKSPKALNRLLSEVPEVDEDINSTEPQTINDLQENIQMNGDVSDEIENNEVIEEILNDTETIPAQDEDNIIDDIVNSETDDVNMVSEVTEDSSEHLDER